MKNWHQFQKRLYGILHQQGRVCLHCSSFVVNDSLFCAICEAQLWRTHSEITEFHEPGTGISGKALFSWYPDQDRMVSKLLLSLKTGRCQTAIDYYVARFCSQFPAEQRIKNAILVPCPSLQTADHASALAQSFSQLLNLSVKQVLKKNKGQGPQKGLGRAQRLSREIVATEDVAHRHVIFIDDILTTGGTAAAAKRALGLKGGFEVWCLGRRQRGLGF